MTQPPLNPDGVLNAMDTLMAETDADARATEWARKVTTRVLEGYFAAALPEVTQSEELSILIGDVKTAIDHEHIDPREFIDLNDVLWALEAQAKPEVTSVEVVPAKLQTISWESNPEHNVWTLEQDQTFVGLVVDAQRGWSMADKITLHIERPEVKP